jgi:hypothetical protein
VAIVQRAPMERELDVPPTRVRILLTDEGQPTSSTSGFSGVVQGGTCSDPDDRIRLDLDSEDGADVRPYQATGTDGDPVTVASYGAAPVPGLGLAAAYIGDGFSVALTPTASAEATLCGEVLEPAEEEFRQAGIALVQLRPVSGEGVSGFALVQRVGMQRELDVTPTRVSVLLFAPPVGG